jgi:hypothetical protein
MENPQEQMPQGQPQPGQEQAQQGQPQAGGQDQQMQQIMQLVQQLMQQGAQPADAAAELLSKQVPPEMIMQVFVQMGMPEQDAQAAIQQAMEGGQQQQGAGEEQMEGEASNPQEEMQEQGVPEEGGQPSPAEEMQMRNGGRMPRQLRRFQNGGANAEMDSIMQKVQEMMQGGADAQQVMQEIQTAAEQGQISPETASAVMEQLSGMQQAQNPQGSDEMMGEQSQDPQQFDPNMPEPDQQMGMAKFGGNLKQLLNRAYGGNAAQPSADSKSYAQDRTNMFVNAVKNNAFKATLNDEFPSLSGSQMSYGGNLPKAEFGLDMALKELGISKDQYNSDKQFKDRADSYVLYENERLKTKANEDVKKPLGEAGKSYQFDPATNSFKAAEQTYEAGKNYQYDPTTKGFKVVDQTQQGYGAVNPVGYQNPMNQGLYGNLYAGASPLARLLAGSGNRYSDPRISGANLPGGMSGAQFLGAAGQNGLTPGMTGTIGDQTWRIGAGEKFKEGSIWKGNRRKGVRYEIDWGNAAAMNPAGNAPGYTPNATAPGYSGYNADANGNNIPDYMQESTGTSSWNKSSSGNPTALPNATNPQNQPTPSSNAQQVIKMPSSGVNEPMGSNNINPNAVIAAGMENPITASNESNLIFNSGNTPTINNPMNGLKAQQPSALNSYPRNNQGQAPIFSNEQPMMSATEQDQIQPVSNVIQNGNYIAYSNPSNTGVPQEFTPAEDLLPAGTENTNVVQQPIKKNNVFSKGTLPKKEKVVEQKNSKPPVKDYETGFSEFVRTNPNIPNPKAARWGKGGTDEQLRRSYDQTIKNAEENKKYNLEMQKKEAIAKKNAGSSSHYAFSNGGGVSQDALSNAIDLINRAFGGMIPKAENGNMGNQGYIEQSNGKKLNIDWNALGDTYMNTAAGVTDIANKMNEYNPEKEQAAYSALNRSSNTYDQMKQGLYDQAGNFIPNDIGNQVLNPTDSSYNNQNQIFRYGGKVYEVGGDVDLDDNEIEELAAAGFKFSKL